jgi:flagellar basal body-associated protein FliL
MALSNIIPLIILLFVVGVAAFVGYHMWLWSNELAERASKKMEKSNVSFRKDGGLRVGVKDIDNEKYTDTTQK